MQVITQEVKKEVCLHMVFYANGVLKLAHPVGAELEGVLKDTGYLDVNSEYDHRKSYSSETLLRKLDNHLSKLSRHDRVWHTFMGYLDFGMYAKFEVF